ncbi:unnamed protein product [Vitrella brassicaformis CCMP3155]|uniref:PSI domain-containing protein n=1 Tax=Vitrella brassicaformis (strain CCMP3155) TaxID=1169540 RepID=A0A0G4H757_VITBC|nr:unnamed protein product [Vitrella brassicaformis CCMP3155]|eukprot:CEM39691.1 unnamed protein product [Vitrella brassicaformis CCMP3155]
MMPVIASVLLISFCAAAHTGNWRAQQTAFADSSTRDSRQQHPMTRSGALEAIVGAGRHRLPRHSSKLEPAALLEAEATEAFDPTHYECSNHCDPNEACKGGKECTITTDVMKGLGGWHPSPECRKPILDEIDSTLTRYGRYRIGDDATGETRPAAYTRDALAKSCKCCRKLPLEHILNAQAKKQADKNAETSFWHKYTWLLIGGGVML